MGVHDKIRYINRRFDEMKIPATAELDDGDIKLTATAPDDKMIHRIQGIVWETRQPIFLAVMDLQEFIDTDSTIQDLKKSGGTIFAKAVGNTIDISVNGETNIQNIVRIISAKWMSMTSD